MCVCKRVTFPLFSPSEREVLLARFPQERWRFPPAPRAPSSSLRMGVQWAPLGAEAPKGAQERCCDLVCKSSKAASPKLAPCCPADPGDGRLKSLLVAKAWSVSFGQMHALNTSCAFRSCVCVWQLGRGHLRAQTAS